MKSGNLKDLDIKKLIGGEAGENHILRFFKGHGKDPGYDESYIDDVKKYYETGDEDEKIEDDKTYPIHKALMNVDKIIGIIFKNNTDYTNKENIIQVILELFKNVDTYIELAKYLISNHKTMDEDEKKLFVVGWYFYKLILNNLHDNIESVVQNTMSEENRELESKFSELDDLYSSSNIDKFIIQYVGVNLQSMILFFKNYIKVYKHLISYIIFISNKIEREEGEGEAIRQLRKNEKEIQESAKLQNSSTRAAPQAAGQIRQKRDPSAGHPAPSGNASTSSHARNNYGDYKRMYKSNKIIKH